MSKNKYLFFVTCKVSNSNNECFVLQLSFYEKLKIRSKVLRFPLLELPLHKAQRNSPYGIFAI